jgi:hypothetical protein
VQELFDEAGQPSDPEKTNKRATVFFNELLWCMEASARMKNN